VGVVRGVFVGHQPESPADKRTGLSMKRTELCTTLRPRPPNNALRNKTSVQRNRRNAVSTPSFQHPSLNYPEIVRAATLQMCHARRPYHGESAYSDISKTTIAKKTERAILGETIDG